MNQINIKRPPKTPKSSNIPAITTLKNTSKVTMKRINRNGMKFAHMIGQPIKLTPIQHKTSESFKITQERPNKN